jgi:hypothetical protein
MKGRQCVAAFIIRNQSNSPAPSAAVTSPPRRDSIMASKTPPQVSSQTLVSSPGQLPSLYSSPIARTPERNRKTGEVYFIIDEHSILIASPDKSQLDKGNLLYLF